MRTKGMIAAWLLLLSFACTIACGQGNPLNIDVFAEGGGSFLSNGALGAYCNVDSLFGCTYYSRGFSYGARLFAGARFRFTSHDAIEASYAYSPNPFALPYAPPDRLDVISFNYVRYFGVRTRVQPFATVGIGANHFTGLANLGYPSANGFYFVGNFGAGADVVLQRHVALRLELRDYVGPPPSFLSGTSHDIVPSVGIVIRLK